MKRLIVCCDGTWNRPERLEPESARATNVLRMSRATVPTDSSGVVQVTEYVRGIGTGNLLNRLAGGATGKGITSNILQAYQFISNNFEPGDEIYLFGFSRGAFTARSLSGFIRHFAILEKRHQHKLPRLYRLYQRTPRSELPKVAAGYRWMADRRLLGDREYIPIHFLGVWDTVGALGVPSKLIRWSIRRRIQFHDTDLADNVSHAFHALALHEFRKQFPPTLWTRSRPDQTVEQVWFPGAHADVGGGVRDNGLPNAALLWMAGRAASVGLELDLAELARHMPNPLVPVSESRSGFYRLWKPRVRLIGPGHLHPKYKPVSVEEFRHESVDERLGGMPGTIRFNRPRHVIEADHRSVDPGLATAPVPKYL